MTESTNETIPNNGNLEAAAPICCEGSVSVVKILHAAGIDVQWACSGSEGHDYSCPTIAFSGTDEDALRAMKVAGDHHLAPYVLRRFWGTQQLANGDRGA